MSSTLEALLQSMMPGGNTDVSSQTGNVAISVNDTSTIQEQTRPGNLAGPESHHGD